MGAIRTAGSPGDLEQPGTVSHLVIGAVAGPVEPPHTVIAP